MHDRRVIYGDWRKSADDQRQLLLHAGQPLDCSCSPLYYEPLRFLGSIQNLVSERRGIWMEFLYGHRKAVDLLLNALPSPYLDDEVPSCFPQLLSEKPR